MDVKFNSSICYFLQIMGVIRMVLEKREVQKLIQVQLALANNHFGNYVTLSPSRRSCALKVASRIFYKVTFTPYY